MQQIGIIGKIGGHITVVPVSYILYDIITKSTKHSPDYADWRYGNNAIVTVTTETKGVC